MHYSFRFLLATLAVWRVTHFLSKEDGPWDVVAGLRRRLNGGFLSGLLSCFYCLSVWIAVPFTFILEGTAIERVVAWLALSGAAILLERMGNESLEIKIEDK